MSSRCCVSCRFCQNSFAISINLHVPLKKNFLWIWTRRIRESGWSSGIASCWRSSRNWGRCGEKADIEGEGVDVVLGAPRWPSPGWSCRVSFSQRFSWKRTGGTDFVSVCFWHHSTSAMWIFKSSYLISFWFAGTKWLPLISSIS